MKPASLVLALLSLVLAGCGVGAVVAPSSSATAQLSGRVHGGNQPLSSAVIQLYAMSSAGDGSQSTPLLNQTVTTDHNGGFVITSDYACPTQSTPVYLAAVGGNPGLPGTVNNSAITLLASLGACGGLSSSTYININEVTTVGTLAALFPFASSYSAIGYGSSDAALFNTAIANVDSYVSFASGSAPGPALPSGYYASSKEINALANSLVPCINSTGGTANDGSDCGVLFGLAILPGASAPTDTVGAMLEILSNPTQNVTQIFNYSTATPPFEPTVTTAPASWVLPITSTANPAITVAVSGASTADIGSTSQYTATVSGVANQAVTWQVNGVTGGTSSAGTISPSGLYTPPATVPASNPVTITASSEASKTASGSLPVYIPDPVTLITGAGFSGYAAAASADNLSPVTAVAGDATLSWVAPDSRSITLTVQAPHPLSNAPTVTLVPPAAGADARPAFDTAIAAVKSQHAGKLVIPQGTYTFGTTHSGCPVTCFLYLSGLTDVTIDGQGSTFIFSQPQIGIYIDTSIRMELANIVVQYSVGRHLAFVGTMSTTTPYTLTAQNTTITASDVIGYMEQVTYNATSKTIQSVVGGARYNGLSTRVFNHANGMTDASFTSAMAGLTFLVVEDTNAGHAIIIKDAPQSGAQQTSDITMNNITVNSSPDMAFAVLGLKRGLLIENSAVTPALLQAATGTTPAIYDIISSEADGIHITQAGGDVYLNNNTIANQVDDAINLAFPVQLVNTIDTTNTQINLANFSRMIQSGDTLAFFDRLNNYLGSATVVGTPTVDNTNCPSGYTPCDTVVINNPVTGLVAGGFVRDMNLIGGRMAVTGNTIQNCQCHGVLAQDPNVLVQNNTITNTAGNGIRALTFVGYSYLFQEGTGAINVLINNNNVSSPGFDADVPGGSSNSYAGISVYGAWSNGYTSAPSNTYVNVTNNTVTSAQQDCLMVSSSTNVNLTGNTCNSDDLATAAGTPSILVQSSNTVNVQQNVRSGTLTGGIKVTGSSNVTTQTNY